MSEPPRRRRFVFARRNPRWRPPVGARVVTRDMPLPSTIDGIDFAATFRAAWTSDDPQISAQHGYALTMQHLWKKAEPITKQWHVLHCDAAQVAVNAAIDPEATLES